jgi:hypothetical protein
MARRTTIQAANTPTDMLFHVGAVSFYYRPNVWVDSVDEFGTSRDSQARFYSSKILLISNIAFILQLPRSAEKHLTSGALNYRRRQLELTSQFLRRQQ